MELRARVWSPVTWVRILSLILTACECQMLPGQETSAWGSQLQNGDIIVPVMGQEFVSPPPQNLYVEALTPNVMVWEVGPLEGN